MLQGRVRAIAIAVITRGERIFVAEGYDPVKGETFYRPLGGTIEFGELGRQTIVRELQEELNAQVTVGRYLGTVENIFTFNGKTGHEIVMVYEAEFDDQSFYQKESLQAVEAGYALFRALWKPLSLFRSGQAPLYPTGLLEMLEERQRG